MVDVAKKVRKQGGEFLHPGEEVLAATVINPVGSFKKNVAFGAVGGLVGVAIGSAVSRNGEEPEAGTSAESFPVGKNALLALTDRRWLLFELGTMSGKVKGLAGEWPHEHIASLSGEKGRLTTVISVEFADGSVAQVEAVKGVKPEDLIQASTRL